MSAPELAEISPGLQEAPVVGTLSESPRGARRVLHTQVSQQQEETTFGASVETVEPPRRSSAPPGGSTNNVVEAPEVTAAPLQRQASEGVDLRREADVAEGGGKGRVQLVSKQSRPFLMLKIVQFLFAAVVLSLNVVTWPVMLLRGNIHIAMQPAVACVTFLVYCPVVFFGYLAKQPTPAAVMLLLDMLGGVYFTIAAVTFGVYWADLEWLLDQTHSSEPPLSDLEHLSMALAAIGLEPDLHLTADKLLMQSLLCSSAATMFLGDVFLTIKYLVLRRLPITNKHKPLI